MAVSLLVSICSLHPDSTTHVTLLCPCVGVPSKHQSHNWQSGHPATNLKQCGDSSALLDHLSQRCWLHVQEIAGGETPDDYAEVIDCNPVSPSRLNVPLNAFTQSTSQVLLKNAPKAPVGRLCLMNSSCMCFHRLFPAGHVTAATDPFVM